MSKILIIPGVRRAVVQDDQYSRITFNGFPYSGQMKGGLDFHGTRFTPETELGMIDRDIPVYWEHGMGELKRQVVARARIGDEFEEGRLLEVVIDRASRYHDFLMELDELGFLRGSGQAIGTMYEESPIGGVLEAFHLGEYSMTVEPSNYLAAPIDYEQARSLIRSKIEEDKPERRLVRSLLIKHNLLEEDDMNKKRVRSADLKTEVVQDEQVEEVSEMEAAIAEAADEAVAENDAEVEEVLEIDLAETLRSFMDAIRSLEAKIDAVSANQTKAAAAITKEVLRNLPKIAAQAKVMGTAEAEIEAEAPVVTRSYAGQPPRYKNTLSAPRNGGKSE